METVEDDVNINQCDIKDLIPTLFRLQSQRCLTYQRLHDAQTMFLNTRNLPTFQNFLSDITIIFARISEDILLIKKRFEDKKLIFKHIEQLQEYEKKKLQFTNDLFVATIEKKNEQFEEINQKLIELVDNINEILEELRYDQEDFSLNKT
jgi:hypothetical protein